MRDILTKVLTLAVIIWLLGSWADVLAHNAPCYGDYRYQRWNAIVLFTEALR